MKKFILSTLLISLTNLAVAFADVDQQSGGEPLMNIQLSNSTFEKIETSNFYDYVSTFKNQLMAFTTKIEGRNVQLYLYNQTTEEIKEFQLDLDLISPDFHNVIISGSKSLRSKKWEKVYFPN